MADQDQKQPASEPVTETSDAPAAEPETVSPDAGGPAPESGRPVEGGDDGSPEDDSGESELDRLQEEIGQLKDLAMRAQADAQNVKRRAEMDVEKARKFALDAFARELLPVVDNLERALEAASGTDEQIKPIADGVELTLKSLLDVLSRFQIEAVNPEGEPFDPQLHQAMSMVENPEVEPNTVIAVMQKGYTLHGRLVRPAMVMVSKAAN